MLRACVIPNHEFQNVNLNVIESCGKFFYTLYEKVFGPGNCSYNTHVVGAHILPIRAHGPLTQTSAFGFENFYGEMRNSFVPGTSSPLKQIMEKIYVKRALADHVCLASIHITNYDTELECNNLIYTFTHHAYALYKVIDVLNEEEILQCHKITTSDAFFEDAPNLDWRNVGVFQLESIGSTIHNISQKYVCGKLIKINDLLITCPNNVLDEK